MMPRIWILLFMATFFCRLEAVTKQELAINYYKEQDHQKAFSTFLEALQEIETAPKTTVTSAEQKLYSEALKTYLSHSALTAQESSKLILQKCKATYEEHPDYHLLGFLLAISYANLGEFDDFFKIFYNSYQKEPEHYLAYKTKAILHIKLFEKARTPNEKDAERTKIVRNLEIAASKFPSDSSLYKLIIAFSTQDSKKEAIIKGLNKIISENILVSRQDIAFFVKHALNVDQKELAQRFVDKTRDWHPYSRAIEGAQELINQHN